MPYIAWQSCWPEPETAPVQQANAEAYEDAASNSEYVPDSSSSQVLFLAPFDPAKTTNKPQSMHQKRNSTARVHQTRKPRAPCQAAIEGPAAPTTTSPMFDSKAPRIPTPQLHPKTVIRPLTTPFSCRHPRISSRGLQEQGPLLHGPGQDPP
jgi:hypothetical protein